MVHYKLHYFGLGGRGEFIRQIFAQGGIEFEDYRITIEEWPELKSKYPNSQVPILEVDGKVLTQSYAIARFVAKKAGLAGKDDWEAAQADMYVDGIEEIIQKIVPLIIATVFGSGNMDEAIKKFRPEMLPLTKGDKGALLTKLKPEVIEPFLTKYEKILKDNGGSHFVGKHLTWADITIADFAERFTWIDPHILDNHAVLKKFVHDIHELPNIKKHIAHRPQMPW